MWMDKHTDKQTDGQTDFKIFIYLFQYVYKGGREGIKAGRGHWAVYYTSPQSIIIRFLIPWLNKLY